MEGDRLGFRREIALLRVIHLLPIVIPLLVARDDAVSEPQQVPFHHLLDVSDVIIADKGANVIRPPVFIGIADLFRDRARRLIERHQIEGDVHMSVVVDPFRPDPFSMNFERCGNLGRVEHRKSF